MWLVRNVLLVVLCLAIAAPSAQAQSSMKLDVTVDPPSDPLAEGQAGTVQLTVTRQCSNLAQVGPETELAVAFQGPDGTVFDGPDRLALEQQPCTVESQQTVEASYQVTLPAAMEPFSTVSVPFTVTDLGDGSPVAPPSDAYSGEFMLSKAGNSTGVDDTTVSDESDAPANEAPAPSGFLALALVGLVAFLRRRA